MRRLGLAVILVATGCAGAQARDDRTAIPEFNYRTTCESTPPVAMDRKQQLESCLNDEKQAKADLPKQWSRSKGEWRSSCLRQTTLGGLASYVELLTCLEMHDPNPPSLNRPGLTQPNAPPPGSGSVTRSPTRN